MAQNKREVGPNQLLKVFVDMMIQTTALQYALVEHGVLTWDQIAEQFDKLSKTRQLRAFRKALKVGHVGIEELLKTYKGPIQ
ncbi:MAG: hypothetical protein ABSH49_36900 [Bryobacteraceae bacterium]|jgi:hypothetical protein